jgi:nitroreductase
MKDGLPYAKSDECILCDQCGAVCPVGAMTNIRVPQRDVLSLSESHPFSAKDAEKFIRSRRSIRHWKKEIVTEEETRILLDIGRYAPTGSNTQSVSYIVVASKEKMMQVREITMEWYRTSENPKIQKLYQSFANEKDKGNDLLFRNAPMLIIACGARELMPVPLYAISPQFALSYIELYAPSLGLGTCYSGYFTQFLQSGNKEIRNLLGIADDRDPGGALLFGYPKYRYYRTTNRQDLCLHYLSK